VAVLLGGRAANVVLAAAASVVLARYLGTEQFGQYGAIYAYLSLLVWLANLGLEPVLTREAARQREQASSILLTGMAICAVASVGTMLLALAIAPQAGYRGRLLLLLFIGAIELYLVSPARIAAVIFQVDLRQWYNMGINLFRQILWLGMVGALALLHAPLLYVVAFRSLSAAVEAVLLWQMSRQFLPPPRAVWFGKIKGYIWQSLPVAFSAIVGAVYMRIDQVMLHKLASASSLGYYVAAVKVSELFEALPAAVLFTVFPVLAKVAGEHALFRQYLGMAFRYLSVAICAVCVAITVGAGPLVVVIYGQQYTASAGLLSILIWSEVAVFFGTVLVNALLATGLQRFLMLPTALGALANVLLNLYLIPRYGAAGAAWATVISYLLAWIVGLLPFPSARPLVLQGLRVMLPAAALALLSVGLVSLLHVPVFIGLPLALGLYAFGVWTGKLFHRADIVYIGEALRAAWPRAN
jgi:PST family polysaccharide transporter